MVGKNYKICSLESFSKKLKDRNMRGTAQRTAVHKAMMVLEHATAEKVINEVINEGDIEMTVATVYNILTQMADAGIYGRRMSSDNKMHFDIVPTPHVHLYDSVNNEFRNVNDEGLAGLVEKYLKGKKYRGYKIDMVDIQMICHPTRTRKK